jgi:hypothetical protein
VRTEVVAKGASAPNLLGKFHDKTAIEVDRTGGSCDGYVYYAWSRFTGNAGHQGYPDISADDGILHTLWWDSRNDACYSPTRPVGNCANRTTVPSLDVYAAVSNDHGDSWSVTQVTDVKSNGNYEQFDNRTVPFGGDYLWITSRGSFAFGAWTDWRNTVQGTDPREVTEDEDNATADVKQCRTFDTATGAWSGDHARTTAELIKTSMAI